MQKKIAIILSVIMVVAALFVLTGCAANESYDFTALKGDTSGEVSSNGGIVVLKGNYYYIVNGALSSASKDNTFGTPIAASVIRISKDNFEKALKETDVQAFIDANAEIVVPKIVYSGNTSDKSVNGIYIYNERLYYFTPNTDVDKNGAALYDQLSLKSCKLDGTDTQHHYTFTSNKLAISLQNNGGTVYAIFADADSTLQCVEVLASGSTIKKVADKATTVKFDTANNSTFYLDADGSVCGYVAGGTAKVLFANPSVKGDTYSTTALSLTNADGNKVYFKYSNTYDISNNGVYSVDMNGASKRILNNVPTGCYVSNNIMYVSTATNSINYLYAYDLGSKISSRIAASSSTVTLVKVVGSNVYYTVGTAVNCYNGSTVSQTSTLAMASYWGTYDECNGYVFFFYGTSDGKGWYPTIIANKEDSSKYFTITKGFVPAPTTEEK